MIVPKEWVIAIALVGAGVFGWGFIKYERDVGAAMVLVGQAKADADHWKAESGKRDTVYKTRVVHLKAVRDTTDTVLAGRTAPIPVDTARHMLAVERAACDSAITASESRCEAKDSIIAALNRRIAAEVKLRPGFFQRTAGKLPWLGVGALLGHFLIH